MLMIEGGEVAFTRFCAARNSPEATPVSEHEAFTIAAPGAAAVGHSVARIASLSSPGTPGEAQLDGPVGGCGLTLVSEPEVYCESPKVVRKVVQSEALYNSVSSITASVCPVPVIPLANKGLKSYIVARSAGTIACTVFPWLVKVY